MSILKMLYRVVLVFLGLLLFFFLLSPFSSFRSINSFGKQLVCKNNLKMIAKAFKLYQADWDGQWPESLEAMKKFYDPPNLVPRCPGERNEQEASIPSEYYYYPPKDKDVVPVCWDSKPHCFKGILLPDILPSNVLYSDGHIENLSEGELFRELFILAKTNPDVLKVLNYPDKKISYSRLTLFLVGIAIGLIFTRCYKFVTKK